MNDKHILERRRQERGEATDGNVGAGTSAAPAGNVGAGTSAAPAGNVGAGTSAAPAGNVGAGTSAAPAGNVGAGTSAPATTPSPGPIVSDDRDGEDKVGAGVTH